MALPSPSWAFGWSRRSDKGYRFALGSAHTDGPNEVGIHSLVENPATGKLHFKQITSFEHPFPATTLQFVPGFATTNEDILCMGSDGLYLYHVHSERPEAPPRLIHKLANQRSKYPAIASFDWNPYALSHIVCVGTDGILTLWDVLQREIVYDLYAHSKKPCYQVQWEPKNPNNFVSCGADGTLRYFDKRASETCHMLFQTPDGLPPISRFAFNEELPYYIACSCTLSDQVFVIDTRQVKAPVAVLRGHSRGVNTVAWAPGMEHILGTGSEDGMAMLWSVSREHARRFQSDWSHIASSRRIRERIAAESSRSLGGYGLNDEYVSPGFKEIPAFGVIDTPLAGYEFANPIDVMSWCPYNSEYVGVIEGDEFHMVRF